MKAHPYACMRVTVDGHTRHDLLPNGRYDEARRRKQSAYQGSYTITGNHIDYVDVSTTPAAMILYRED